LLHIRTAAVVRVKEETHCLYIAYQVRTIDGRRCLSMLLIAKHGQAAAMRSVNHPPAHTHKSHLDTPYHIEVLAGAQRTTRDRRPSEARVTLAWSQCRRPQPLPAVRMAEAYATLS
ncbi:unnamed protein product, partial [Laminaria digitata]